MAAAAADGFSVPEPSFPLSEEKSRCGQKPPFPPSYGDTNFLPRGAAGTQRLTFAKKTLFSSHFSFPNSTKVLANSGIKANISAHNGGPEQNGFSALVVTPKRRSCLFLFLSQRRHNHDLSHESFLFFFKTGSKRAQFQDYRNVDTRKRER